MSESDQGRADGQSEGVDLTKGEGAPGEQQPFDPYRFGRPEHPIPAEYAPPGYTGPTVQNPPPSPYGPPPAGYPGAPANPFGNPPGTPYGAPPPYPPAGSYNAPPPPHYSGYPAPPTGNGKAIAALVFGILSIVLCFLFFFDGIFVILGLIFSIIALNETKGRGGNGRGMAVAGLVCTIVGALIATVLTVFLVRAVNKCGGFENNNTSSQTFKTCLQDNFFK